MNAPISPNRVPLIALAFLAAVVLLVWPNPVSASETPVFAGWFTNLFSGLATRSRVIQVSVVTMCLALFIIMKKFADAPSGPRR